MKEIFLLIVLLITATVGFNQWIIDSVFNFYKSGDEVDVQNINDFQVNDLISEENENVKESDYGLKKFYEKDNVLCESSNKKYENLVSNLDNYIQRYISLFLITSDLLDYKVNDLQEIIKVDFEVNISGKDLAYLQGYSKIGKKSTPSRNLFKLDAIFSNIVQLKKKSFVQKSLHYFYSLFTDLIIRALNTPNFYYYFSFIIILIVTYLSYCIFFQKLLISLGILVNSLVIWESFNLYSKKLKEVDVKIFLKIKEFQDLPESCDPANQKWLDNLLYYILPNKCQQYYEYLNKNPVEEVSLFKCIIDTYTYYFVQTPIRVLGASIRDFTGEISDLWPWWLKYFITVPLVPYFAVIALFFVLVLCGKRLKLSFLGAAVELGDSNKFTKNERTALSYSLAPKALREIRKLRPWTKTKFHRRLERDFGTRKKMLSLKTYKSFCESPQNKSNNTLGSSENSDVGDFNKDLNSLKLDESINDRFNQNKLL